MKTELGIRMGARARDARKHLGFTQADVAGKLGVAREVYARLERGHMLPSVTTLRRVCTVLKVPPHELLALDHLEAPVARPRVNRVRNNNESPALRELLRNLRGLGPGQLRLLGLLAASLPPPSRRSRKP